MPFVLCIAQRNRGRNKLSARRKKVMKMRSKELITVHSSINSLQDKDRKSER